MPQFDVEIAAPVLPITAASPDGDILRLQEWLVVRGISVGENPAAAPGSATAVGVDGDFGPTTQRGVRPLRPLPDWRMQPSMPRSGQVLTSGMRTAFSFKAAQSTIGDAVVETARAHLAQRPLEARRFIDGGLKGRDNSGPWVRAYCLGHSDQWCQGAASQLVKQAFATLGQPLPFPLDGNGIAPLYVPSIVESARRNNHLVAGFTPVPPGSFFFVRGILNGLQSHIHVDVTISAMRPDGRFDAIEGNTKLDGSQNGWECVSGRDRGPAAISAC